MKKIQFIEEIYTDEYSTLQQAILWNVDLDKQSNGMESSLMKSSVNPNLTTLLERRYLDKKIEELENELSKRSKRKW